ncbi:hypothetical protein ANCCAN_08763 [Ancylostoma caninum]|uniref:Uncharacterized protein n=1 Tax=Ancylostoma caninum TaxID=29170 RepID=A0A368GLK6_ANCCA|nr:hypothetical protein ANCCAN_08763 [Ancylostoma caninum]
MRPPELQVKIVLMNLTTKVKEIMMALELLVVELLIAEVVSGAYYYSNSDNALFEVGRRAREASPFFRDRRSLLYEEEIKLVREEKPSLELNY